MHDIGRVVQPATDSRIEPVFIALPKFAGGQQYIRLFRAMLVIRITVKRREQRKPQLNVITAFHAAGSDDHPIHVPLYIICAAIHPRRPLLPAERRFECLDRASSGKRVWGGWSCTRWIVSLSIRVCSYGATEIAAPHRKRLSRTAIRLPRRGRTRPARIFAPQFAGNNCSASLIRPEAAKICGAKIGARDVGCICSAADPTVMNGLWTGLLGASLRMSRCVCANAW